MKLDQLEALGFTVVAGQIDRNGKNWGFLAPTGPVLTPEGEALAAELQAAQAPVAAPKAAKEPKASKTAKVEAPVAPVEPSDADLLQGLLDE
jgi:hypothetical protein